MSRLMNDLNKLGKSHKTDNGIVLQEVEEPKNAPVANNRKTVYFIGFLIVLIVFLSVFSMSVSLTSLSRIDAVEKIAASTNDKVLARLDDSEKTSVELLKTFKEQNNAIRDLKALMAEQNKSELAWFDELKDQLKGINIALKEKASEIEEINISQNSLKTLIEESVDDLKIADKLMREKYFLLSDKVNEIVEKNAYLYSTY